jgi:hypothetical protein
MNTLEYIQQQMKLVAADSPQGFGTGFPDDLPDAFDDWFCALRDGEYVRSTIVRVRAALCPADGQWLAHKSLRTVR